MNAKVTVNVAEFERQIQEIVKVGKLTAAEALNKNAVKVLIGAREGTQGELTEGAVHITPKATAAQIKRDLDKKYSARTGKKFGLVRHPVKLLFIKASKKITKEGTGKGRTFAGYRAHVASVSKNIASARDQSRAYLAAGWLNCLPALGFTPTTRGVKLYPGRKAARSYSLRATAQNLKVSCFNAAAEPGTRAGAIIEKALDRAIGNAAADMAVYTKRKMEEAMQRAAAIREGQKGITIRYA